MLDLLFLTGFLTLFPRAHSIWNRSLSELTVAHILQSWLLFSMSSKEPEPAGYVPQPSLEPVFLALPLSTFASLLILNIDCLKNKHNKRYTSTRREQCNSTPVYFFKGGLWPVRDCSKTIRSLSHKFAETSSYKRATSKRRLKCSALKSSKRFILKY